MRHLISVTDLSSGEIERIFAITEDLKTKYAQGLREPLLPGRVMALLFEKPSMRTRVSFEAGMINLGGQSLLLGNDTGFGSRESIADFGRVLSQYVDTIVVRAKRHETVVELAQYCTCSVINGLTDFAHPCQALADLYTLKELIGSLNGHTLAFIGDGNNVSRSLLEGCGLVGMRFVMATPVGYRLDAAYLKQLKKQIPRLDFHVTDSPAEAVRGAIAVYTDVWASMGQEAESAKRRRDFLGYQVNAALMAEVPETYFMHCLPAHRGEEVTDEVIDGPQSIVVQQAANRLHVQKGILAWLLGRQAGIGV
ncbi:MAG TPA: ornithine carbamoyltransferase [Pirellulales bacterium]|jgi:ornithine carbamoyltransferase|nr:ornithine carbamoyltransferase [Pirellulales bacterium]